MYKTMYVPKEVSYIIVQIIVIVKEEHFMDWKQEAIEKLRQYKVKQAALQEIPLDIQMLEAAVQSAHGARTDKIAVKNSGSGEDALINNIVRREELMLALEQTKHWVSRVERGLAALGEEEQLILNMLFIQPVKGNADRLCELLCVEQASVYRRRDKALLRFTKALYGCLET